MNLVAFFDVLALVAFTGTIAVAVYYSMSGPQKIPRNAALLIMLTFASTAFVMFSNTLEHLGVTAQLDWYEDLVGIAFFPLLGYAYYLIWVDQQMGKLRASVRAESAEHEMLMNVMDATPVAIMIVDEVGRVSFANEHARTALELPLETGGPYYESAGTIAPQGSERELASGALFDASVAGRSFQGEAWEYVAGDTRVPLGLSAAPLTGGAGSGSVVVFSAVSTMGTPSGGHDAPES